VDDGLPKLVFDKPLRALRALAVNAWRRNGCCHAVFVLLGQQYQPEDCENVQNSIHRPPCWECEKVP
jgi:hypothetical protein